MQLVASLGRGDLQLDAGDKLEVHGHGLRLGLGFLVRRRLGALRRFDRGILRNLFGIVGRVRFLLALDRLAR